jgi:3-deoxy-D-manno-octulosonic-acid transferase
MLHAAVGDGVQLLCAPRRPEWFDDAATDLPGCARRSHGDIGSPSGRFLLDTIGELRMAYALADVVVIGRTFSDLGGSDMIEPIALGKPTIVGPDVTNFAAIAMDLLNAGGLVQTTSDRLPYELKNLLAETDRSKRLVQDGRSFIRTRQGATARHAAILRELGKIGASR